MGFGGLCLVKSEPLLSHSVVVPLSTLSERSNKKNGAKKTRALSSTDIPVHFLNSLRTALPSGGQWT